MSFYLTAILKIKTMDGVAMSKISVVYLQKDIKKTQL